MTQQKVLDATGDESWGPSADELQEIAKLTYNLEDRLEIISIIDFRLKGENTHWKRVVKSLTVLDFLLHVGDDAVVDWAKEYIDHIKKLREFIYFDVSERDQGLVVRTKAREIVALLSDDELLKLERKDANQPQYASTQTIKTTQLQNTIIHKTTKTEISNTSYTYISTQTRYTLPVTGAGPVETIQSYRRFEPEGGINVERSVPLVSQVSDSVSKEPENVVAERALGAPSAPPPSFPPPGRSFSVVDAKDVKNTLSLRSMSVVEPTKEKLQEENEIDEQMKKAIEESKKTAEEDKLRRENLKKPDNDEDLRMALLLSQEEEEMRKQRDLEEQEAYEKSLEKTNKTLSRSNSSTKSIHAYPQSPSARPLETGYLASLYDVSAAPQSAPPPPESSNNNEPLAEVPRKPRKEKPKIRMRNPFARSKTEHNINKEVTPLFKRTETVDTFGNMGSTRVAFQRAAGGFINSSGRGIPSQGVHPKPEVGFGHDDEPNTATGSSEGNVHEPPPYASIPPPEYTPIPPSINS